LKRLFEALGIDFVVDVGANKGQYRDFLREVVGFQGGIASFEPDPALVEVLRGRARRDHRWQVFGLALSSTSGTANFNVMAESQFNSFLTPRTDTTGSIARQNRIHTSCVVETKTLDEVVPLLEAKYGFRCPYLKMDTQGHDLEVIRGARKTIEQFGALQTEASVRPIYDGMPDYRTTIRTLEDHGFVLSGMYSVTDECFPVLLEFDCVMVNSTRTHTA
jgi:FkbM family methyltransferase